MNKCIGGKNIKNITTITEEKLLGQGSFGCVIKPEPKCNQKIVDISNYKPKDSIAKIYTDDLDYDNDINIIKEIEFSKLFSKIDKNQNYFVMPIKFCKNTRNQMDEHNAFKLCKTSPEQKEFIFSVMENEEYDFYEYIYYYKKTYQKLFPKKAWIILLNNLLKGVKLLVNNKSVHQDIKANNITYKNKLKFIDFGLFEHFKDIYTTKNPRLQYYFNYYPLEYILVHDYLYDKKYIKYDKKSASLRLLYNFYESIYDYGPIGINNYYHFVTNNRLENKALKQIKKYLSNPDLYYKNVHKYTNKIDLYSLGTLCVYINHLLSDDGLTKYELKKYNKFVKGLIEIDPSKRYDINNALIEYNTILQE